MVEKYIFFAFRSTNESTDNTVNDMLKELLTNDISGPKFPIQTGRLWNEKELWSYCPETGHIPDWIEERQKQCMNYSDEQIKRAGDTFQEFLLPENPIEMANHETLTQESFVAPEDIGPRYGTSMPTIPGVVDNPYPNDDDSQNRNKINNDEISAYLVVDETSSDVFDNNVHEKCDEEYGETLVPSSFIKLMMEEITDLKKMFRSANYNNNAVDLMKPVASICELTRSIRKDMAQRSNHNHGQEWVSSNSEHSRHCRRFRGAKLGLTQFD